MKFTYSSGQRPLDGYTIKRGIGKGGFGEVYFALSDGGKEVALKMIRNNLDVELRGMSQCLNFKHPNLIQLYDIRQDGHGDHWVIMEYVSGESLHAILNRHAHGLPPELVQQWFQGLASAVTYLHDHGVVHRDLKPGNIFVENGTVKVGDYGLCKCVSGSQRSAQTQSVGTVHYMAPEISTGNYNKQIDVYAAGIVLYEMLTGRVPFEGESVGEILMKHLTAAPDLNRLPGTYRNVLRKALAKNPVHRHRSMADLVKDLQAVTEPTPVLEATVLPATMVAPPAPDLAKPLYHAKPLPVKQPEILSVQPVVIPKRTQVAELCQSIVTATLLAALFTILWAALMKTGNLVRVGQHFFLAVACCWAILITAKLWTRRVSESLSRRAGMMCVGLIVGVLALFLGGEDLTPLLVNQEVNAQHVTSPETREAFDLDRAWQHASPLANVTGYLSYFGLAFFGLRWWQLADRRRSQRFSLYSVVAAGVLGVLLMFVWPGQERALGVVTLVMTAIIVQLVSPWQQAATPKPRRLRLPNA